MANWWESDTPVPNNFTPTGPGTPAVNLTKPEDNSWWTKDAPVEYQHVQTLQGNYDITENDIRRVESANGKYTYNPKSGASGDMQVTFKGAASDNPGFGVTPAKDRSPAELHRVGVDYWNALKKHYGNPIDAAVAYNWGPGHADKWIAQGKQWQKLPRETSDYVMKLIGMQR